MKIITWPNIQQNNATWFSVEYLKRENCSCSAGLFRLLRVHHQDDAWAPVKVSSSEDRFSLQPLWGCGILESTWRQPWWEVKQSWAEMNKPRRNERLQARPCSQHCNKLIYSQEANFVCSKTKFIRSSARVSSVETFKRVFLLRRDSRSWSNIYRLASASVQMQRLEGRIFLGMRSWGGGEKGAEEERDITKQIADARCLHPSTPASLPPRPNLTARGTKRESLFWCLQRIEEINWTGI